MFKICSICKLEKEILSFSKNKNFKDGYLSRCKECDKIYIQKYKDKPYKKNLGYSKKYYWENKHKRDKVKLAKQSREYVAKNRKQVNINKMNWVKRHPDRSRAVKLARYWKDIPNHERVKKLQAMYEEQEYRCKICKIHQDDNKKTLCIDHCHTTKKVRGLLCDRCNHGIGHFKDNIDLMLEAIDYLKKSRE